MNIPSISDDTLQCLIFPMQDEEPSILLTNILTYVNKILPGHIWHRDSFQLTLSTDEEKGLECTMRVGDSVDDEWLVVYLLWQVTKTFDVAVSVYDADGQFLLIEAAESLPSWVTPENVENRVWIYNGHLYLIPLSYTSPNAKRPTRSRIGHEHLEDESENFEKAPYITIKDALARIKKSPEETQAPLPVEDVILERIKDFPQAAKTQIHRTKAALPVDVARALANNPHLIQKAVECFYTRDAIQLRATQKMTRFPPSSSTTVTVPMTRTAYAQLVGQRLNAPRVFHRPLEQSQDEARWWDNGVKIACGFEMLYQESKKRQENIKMRDSDELDRARLDALRRDRDFVAYIARLEHTDYFEGEMKGSEKYSRKEIEAANIWIKMRETDSASRPSFAQLVEEALQKDPNNVLKDEGEDSEDWLNVDIDRSLARYTRSNGDVAMEQDLTGDQENPEDRLAKDQARRMKDLADKMEGFVEGRGDLEGAVFEDELLSDDEEDEVTDSEEEKARRQARMDALVAPLEPGEYGKMPAEYRHANSQTTAPSTDQTEKDPPPKATKEPLSRPIRRPIFQRDKFDGVDSDDETTEEEEGGPLEEGEEDEEDRPQVVGEVEIDMDQEQEDFIRFSREMLGIDDDAWADIIADREKRGVYIPPSAKSSKEKEKEKAPKGPNAAQFFDEIPKMAVTQRPTRTKPKNEDDPTRIPNPDLDSFEAVMDAMEKELAKLKKPPSKQAAARDTKGKGKAKEMQIPPRPKSSKPSGMGMEIDGDEEDEDEDDNVDMAELQQAMDLELRSALKRDVEVVSSGEEGDDSGDEDEGMPMDYNLIKNFLESFKAQQGLSGPVGGLAGRLQGSDWALPRDG
ncbi:hypothetical protein CPB86DRAFT_823118 [Serendipita vermifera]|nr:hypothetical protein CPB86DRAFT_823118 [Serendipita vermifera]